MTSNNQNYKYEQHIYLEGEKAGNHGGGSTHSISSSAGRSIACNVTADGLLASSMT